MFTIINSSVAANSWVGLPTLHQIRTVPAYAEVSFVPFQLGGGNGEYPKISLYENMDQVWTIQKLIWSKPNVTELNSTQLKQL